MRACIFFALCLLPLTAACPPAVEPDPDPEPVCVDDDACVDRCGPAVDACDTEVDCGPCRDEATLNALRQTADEALSLWLDNGYMQDVIDVDLDALRLGIDERLQFDPGTDDQALLRALWFAGSSLRNGHSGVYRTDVSCSELGGADVGASAFGWCAAPAGDGFVVQSAAVANPGPALVAGDHIVAVNGLRGVALVDFLLDQPLCGSTPTHAAGRQDTAAAALFSVLRPGDVLEVEGADGPRTVTLTEADERPLASCRDFRTPFLTTTVRDDNVAVLRLTRFILFEGEEGYVRVVTNEDAEQLIGNMIGIIRAALDDLPDTVRGVVWDARGNIGGASPVGFAIAAGMRGHRDVHIADCTSRVAGTDPIEYFVGGPFYTVPADDRLVVDLPAAVLIDGLAVSAADYFARAVKLATDVPIFGRAPVGGYGGGGLGEPLPSAPNLYIAYDPFRCNDDSGAPLETNPTAPDFLLDQDPADTRAGIDTVLEAAVAHVLDDAAP
jgi:hypothetical protein